MDIIFGESNGLTYLKYFGKEKQKNYLVYAIQSTIKNNKIQNLLGNLSEMTKEYGVAVGGSFLDSSDSCQIKHIKYYNQPHYSIGFRCLYKMKRIN
jgi:myosin-crossreactive antigen